MCSLLNGPWWYVVMLYTPFVAMHNDQHDGYAYTYIHTLGMGDNKNFMSQYIIRVIITIIDIITVSLNSATGTKIVEIS